MSFTPLPIEILSIPAIGVLEKAIEGDKLGRIFYGGTSWFAKSYVPDLGINFLVGQEVIIYARQGNTLLILPSTAQMLLA